MVSDLKTFSNKECKIDAKKSLFLCEFSRDQEVTQQRSGGYTTRIRRFTTRIRRLYNKDQENMFSNAIIESLHKSFDYKGCKITALKSFFFW